MSSTRAATTAADWIICPNCRAIVFVKRWERQLRVCPECGTHGRVDPHTRVRQLADPGSVVPLDPPSAGAEDILGFVDRIPYQQRLAEARARTGLAGGVLAARLTIEGAPAVVAVMDFDFLGGSLGALAGEAITGAAEAALTDRLPLLVVTASGGARMQEGAISLMQMAKTSAAWAKLDEAGLLTVSVITDPTYGGVAASFATLSDVIVAEAGARLGFAGRRVIEQTIRAQLPPEFQTVEFLRERGFVDWVLPRPALRPALAKLLRVPATPSATPLAAPASAAIVRDPARLPARDPWEVVGRARDLRRPTTTEYLAVIFEDFQELRGDRMSGDCPAIVAGLARLAGRPVAVVGHEKGHDPSQLSARNFGMPNPAGYRKAGRVMRLAAKLGLPVVTFVDTPGAFPGRAAEEQGQAYAIAENLRLMASLPVPVVTVINGEGGSGGALGIAVANQVLIWEYAFYSVISPEGCASILWKDSAAAPQAAAALRLTARDLLQLGVVDGVLPEPSVGPATDRLVAAEQLRAALSATLTELSGRSPAQLIDDRRDRFARFGRALPAAPALAGPGPRERNH